MMLAIVIALTALLIGADLADLPKRAKARKVSF
jgi:hypothetical protein